MSVVIKHGNLLDDDAEALVNPVNCVGAMGRGLALQFKERYPDMFAEYRRRCRDGSLRPGCVMLYPIRGPVPRFLVGFPTKDHWRDPSRLEWVRAGLHGLADVCEDRGIASIAVPPLGCGLGGLRWPDVRALIEEILVPGAPNTEIRIYPPEEYA